MYLSNLAIRRAAPNWFRRRTLAEFRQAGNSYLAKPGPGH